MVERKISNSNDKVGFIQRDTSDLLKGDEYRTKDSDIQEPVSNKDIKFHRDNLVQESQKNDAIEAKKNEDVGLEEQGSIERMKHFVDVHKDAVLPKSLNEESDSKYKDESFTEAAAECPYSRPVVEKLPTSWTGESAQEIAKERDMEDQFEKESESYGNESNFSEKKDEALEKQDQEKFDEGIMERMGEAFTNAKEKISNMFSSDK